eukprot:717522-Prymnesium_polylepis.1
MAHLLPVERVAGWKHVRELVVVVCRPEAGVARPLLCCTILQNWLQVLHLQPALNPRQRRGTVLLERVADDTRIFGHLRTGRGNVVKSGGGRAGGSRPADGDAQALSTQCARVECHACAFTTLQQGPTQGIGQENASR